MKEIFWKATNPLGSTLWDALKGMDIFRLGIQHESSSNAENDVYLADQIKKSSSNKTQTPSFRVKYFFGDPKQIQV